ncbi:phage tail protein [Paenibacillus radicis (ex Gao et al. 2016)]|uniref:Tail Collar domain-containing protein n=1 Tax=Paenibacillus radicis (ex Gao et al. 2016) TaxID=1737354 RepID=A0A917M8B2_9BACL|nr:tail fiber protein [Paenibacillus radicis (ex Gao et al. 2016)]GGG84174.1 tail Collar domain-containing protein [Paenibacillus radicis (ex Gao et al. 2016)]
MSQPYVGEIRMFGGNFAPAGWAFCNGQEISISENDTLFNLIGTTYGGDGTNTFKLPDLQGRIPIHLGNDEQNSYVIGQSAGVESTNLTVQQIPRHNHGLAARAEQGNTSNPSNAVLAMSSLTPYSQSGASSTGSMHASSMAAAGGSQPHNNMQPYLCVNFIISLYGVYPS